VIAVLNTYGWWTVGTVAIYAGIGMAIASFAVLLALLFELYRWRVTTKKVAAVKVEVPRRLDIAS